MDLEAIRVLLAVLEHGTVQGAAEALNTARATVRRRLRELEEAAGVALVVRGLRGVTPRVAGTVLARRGRLMVEEMSLVLEEVRSTAAHSAGLLRIVMAEGMAPHYTAGLVAEFLEVSPELSVDIRQSADPLAELMEDTDVALVFNQAGPGGPWRHVPLVATPERLVASPAYLATHPVACSEDLATCSLLVWRSPEYPPEELPLLSGDAVRIRPRLVSSDVHLLHHTALAGGGIALVPDGGLGYETAPTDALVRVLPEEVGRDRWLSIVAAESLRDLPRLQELMTVMQRFAARMRGATPAPVR